jgi:hypothetical protein
MSEFRLSPEAEAELDGIWIHIARESGTEYWRTSPSGFGYWPAIHTWGAAATTICVPAYAALPLTNTSLSTMSLRMTQC